MADPVLIATPKAGDANAYLTQLAAQTYFDGRLNVSEWTSASSPDKDRALIMATARLEQEAYVGSPTELNTQRLKWPRVGVSSEDAELYDQNLVPGPVKDATCELALALLKGEIALAETGLEGFDQVTVGPIAVTPRQARKGGALPQQVIRLLRGIRIGSGMAVDVVRG